MSKPSQRGPQYSREREWGVILEDLQRQFRVFGDGLAGLHERLGGFELEVYKRFERLENEIASIKINYATKKDLERFVTKEDLKKALEPLATKEELRKAVEPLATKKDLEILDRRLTAFETSH